MAFERDLGHAFICLPLKFAVGCITMYISVLGLINMLAVLNSNVKFQPGGYYPPATVAFNVFGMLGILFGFLGLLGVYDDKLPLVRAFTYYLYMRFALQIFVFASDLWVLRDCESIDPTTDYYRDNPMGELHEQHLCKEGRNSYLFGFILDFWMNAYCVYCCYNYLWYLQVNPPYSIDFGIDRYDRRGRWNLYKAKQNPYYAEQINELDGENRPMLADEANYGSYEGQDYLQDPMQNVGKTFGYAH